MRALDGRVAVITGGGRGIGREHALLFAREGASVVVNDLGGANDGSGTDSGPAQQVVDEISALGGRAVANADNVATWDGAAALIAQAVEMYGQLDVVVNNAGILRDGFIVNLKESEWDAVIEVHLKGHFAVLHHAAKHWKQLAKSGSVVAASVVNTVSASGTTLPNAGQANYGVAKAGIAALTLVAAQELQRYGVRVNAIAPLARTRLTEATPGLETLFAAPQDSTDLDVFDPSQISPLVAYLSTADCPITGKLYDVRGGAIGELAGWHSTRTTETDQAWTIEEVRQRLTGWS